MNESYWTRVLHGRLTRRRALAATGATAASAAFLAACGGGDDGGGGNGASGDTGAGDGTGATGSTGTVITDNTTGNVGGTLIWQGYGDPGAGLELIKVGNAGVYQMASLTHDSLLEFAYGQPKYPNIGNEVLPNLATALPEISPDKLTVTFKLRPATFHNGRALTSEDVKWTYDTLAFAEESAYKGTYSWLESTEAPDAETFVIKANIVNADLLQTIAYKNSGAILAREHHESGASEQSLMGSGPYIFESYNPPLETRYKRNPNYEVKPFPYFEEIVRLGTSDPEKKVADVLAGTTHLTYWFPPEERERVLGQRSELQAFKYPEPGGPQIYMRNDLPPFNDIRVRQALSMGYDRGPIIEAATASEGAPDQALSRSGVAWEFRDPSALKRADLFELNVAEAKKLLTAAGITEPLEITMPGWNATVIGQKWVDMSTLTVTQLRNNGLFNITYKGETFGEFAPRLFSSDYEMLSWGPNTTATLPNLGIEIKEKYSDGVDVPTQNQSHVDNPQITELVTKQLEEFDRDARIAIFRELEDILAEEMVHASGINGVITYLADPSLVNAQMPRDAYNGATPWLKYWWFA